MNGARSDRQWNLAEAQDLLGFWNQIDLQVELDLERPQEAGGLPGIER